MAQDSGLGLRWFHGLGPTQDLAAAVAEAEGLGGGGRVGCPGGREKVVAHAGSGVLAPLGGIRHNINSAENGTTGIQSS